MHFVFCTKGKEGKDLSFKWLGGVFYFYNLYNNCYIGLFCCLLAEAERDVQQQKNADRRSTFSTSTLQAISWLSKGQVDRIL